MTSVYVRMVRFAFGSFSSLRSGFCRKHVDAETTKCFLSHDQDMLTRSNIPVNVGLLNYNKNSLINKSDVLCSV